MDLDRTKVTVKQWAKSTICPLSTFTFLENTNRELIGINFDSGMDPRIRTQRSMYSRTLGLRFIFEAS